MPAPKTPLRDFCSQNVATRQDDERELRIIDCYDSGVETLIASMAAAENITEIQVEEILAAHGRVTAVYEIEAVH